MEPLVPCLGGDADDEPRVPACAQLAAHGGTGRPVALGERSVDDAHALLSVDADQAKNTLGSLGEITAAVLGLALTVSSIIVQLAATRFTPIVTSLS